MVSPKVLILLALCVLPALLVEAVPQKYPYHVKGRVYCETCHLGCEHKYVTYIGGAVVKIECYDEQTNALKYSRSGSTDANGFYVIEVRDDHKDERCFAILVSSPQPDCNTIVPELDRVTAIVTNENGVISHERNVNSLGFKSNTKDARCSGLIQLYNSDV
ncbi:hypothetical protein MKW94_028631 [Papaver nudicaule]|uniref:Uncharacterized protein n=1 Tax=Papaver nudicaule TaxID=74823 RepID=A0AA41VHN8_PAPNU|nr:hypothetical protein [Papaver nudicaule]